jgi:acetyltransferase
MYIDPSINPFFAPKGVVIIGASSDPTKLGYGLARNLVQSNYQGDIHFVNIKGGKLLNRPIYPSISKVPDPVDLAAVLIPAQFVPGTLQACGERGIRSVIIGSGGFREVSSEGAALEDKCLAIAAEYGIRLIGPNCVGLLDTHLPIDTTFLPPPGPTPGDVAFISHSGAICAAVIDWARGQGYGLSRLVSLGNQADVCETDILGPVAADPFTRVLGLYIEGVKDGQRFIANARQVSLVKPIIALKVGRFEAGRRAVASHTGALAGQEMAYNAAFRRAGVLRAATSEGMFDRARALAWCPRPKGRRVAVLTNAGGPGVTAADALESQGLCLPELTHETQQALQAILPPAASLHNPVDMLASASPGDFADCLKTLLDDPNIDSAMVIYPTPPMFTSGAVAKAIIPVIHNADKPVVVAVMGERLIQEAVEHLRAAKIPEYRFPERAAAALSALVERAELLEFAQAELVSIRDVNRGIVSAILRTAQDGFLSPEDVDQILAAYRIPTNPIILTKNLEEALDCCQKIGFPVVLKIASPDISHKTDVGGVLLNIEDESALQAGWTALINQVSRARPAAKLDGIYVQRMTPIGQEVIVGTVQDSQFGPLVMFGSGGVEVEGLKDVAFAIAPLTKPEAKHLLESTWAGRRLSGFRSLPPADRESVLDVLYRLAQLATDFPQLVEIEINPLRVLPAGEGAIALDVRLQYISG